MLPKPATKSIHALVRKAMRLPASMPATISRSAAGILTQIRKCRDCGLRHPKSGYQPQVVVLCEMRHEKTPVKALVLTGAISRFTLSL
jgi:hypothetical protein